MENIGVIHRPIPARRWDLKCYYRQAILGIWGLLILSTFWFASRYPALLLKSKNVGVALPSMAFDHTFISLSVAGSVGMGILSSSVNWLAAMVIGMSFGVLFGALLHSVLRYYPLKVGKNLYLNSLKGALIGAPMGVCANCAVPMMCGITRSKGQVEMALGYLFSSPNFNPVVVMMTFAAFPLFMGVVKYVVLMALIALLVPMLIYRLEKDEPLDVLLNDAVDLTGYSRECNEAFAQVWREVAEDYVSNLWMLLKPTLTLMLSASIVAALLLTLIPWNELLGHMTVLRAAVASFLGVFIPVPIALDVMFAAQLQRGGAVPGYVMMFLMTLGTFSIIPAVYLWREVSKRLAVILFLFFWVLGFICALSF